MKRNCIVFLTLSSMIYFSCEKEKIAGSTYLMTVKESKTGIPLPNVTIQLFKCTNYDLVFGCRTKAIFATHTTDANGEYRFDNEINKADEGIVLKKAGYWDGSGGEGERFMDPEAWVEIHLTTQKSYPDTSSFQVDLANGRGGESSKPFRPPKDSTIRLRLVGNETNQLNWSVFYQDCFYNCVVEDIFASGSFSVSAGKFETVKYELAY